MARLEPLPVGAVPELAETLHQMQANSGLVPNTYLIMQRRPEVVQALMGLVDAVIGSASQGEVPEDLKYLVGIVSSQTAGCRYCQANTALGAQLKGVSEQRIQSVWAFRDSPLFTAAERAALEFARAASTSPNEVSDAIFAELERHWTEGQIVELLAVVCLQGFVNRWNDSLSTPLPAGSADAASQLLGAAGWNIGKHVAEG